VTASSCTSFSGPNSIAKSVVEPDNGGRYTVYYTPVEVGLYNIALQWNGKEIEGIFRGSFLLLAVIVCMTFNIFASEHVSGGRSALQPIFVTPAPRSVPAPRPPALRSAPLHRFSATPAHRSAPLNPIFDPLHSIFRSAHMLWFAQLMAHLSRWFQWLFSTDSCPVPAVGRPLAMYTAAPVHYVIGPIFLLVFHEVNHLQPFLASLSSLVVRLSLCSCAQIVPASSASSSLSLITYSFHDSPLNRYLQ